MRIIADRTTVILNEQSEAKQNKKLRNDLCFTDSHSFAETFSLLTIQHPSRNCECSMVPFTRTAFSDPQPYTLHVYTSCSMWSCFVLPALVAAILTCRTATSGTRLQLVTLGPDPPLPFLIPSSRDMRALENSNSTLMDSRALGILCSGLAVDSVNKALTNALRVDVAQIAPLKPLTLKRLTVAAILGARNSRVIVQRAACALHACLSKGYHMFSLLNLGLF